MIKDLSMASPLGSKWDKRGRLSLPAYFPSAAQQARTDEQAGQRAGRLGHGGPGEGVLPELVQLKEPLVGVVIGLVPSE